MREDEAPCRCRWCQGDTCDCGDISDHYPHDDPEQGLRDALWVAHQFIYDQLRGKDDPLHPVLRTTVLACTRYAFQDRPRYHDPLDAAHDWLHIHHGEEPVINIARTNAPKAHHSEHASHHPREESQP